MTEEQIKAMSERFLQWKLPADFSPDAGISFKATFNENTAYPGRHKPTGTNLLTMRQAVEMVRHMVAAIEAPVQEPVAWRYRWKIDGECVGWRVADHSNAHPLLDGFEEVPLYATPHPDETAALRAKLAEAEAMIRVAYDAGYHQAECGLPNHGDVHEVATAALAKIKTDRDEERKLADDLAMSLTEVSSRCGPLAEDGKRAKAVRARHAARRKEQQG